MWVLQTPPKSREDRAYFPLCWLVLYTTEIRFMFINQSSVGCLFSIVQWFFETCGYLPAGFVQGSGFGVPEKYLKPCWASPPLQDSVRHSGDPSLVWDWVAAPEWNRWRGMGWKERKNEMGYGNHIKFFIYAFSFLNRPGSFLFITLCRGLPCPKPGSAELQLSMYTHTAAV